MERLVCISCLTACNNIFCIIGIYYSENINWRIWATEIARLSNHEQERQIQTPPGSHLLHLFQHSPENREQRHAAVTRGLGIALVMADSTIPDLIELEEDIAEILDRQRISLQKLKAYRRILEGQREIVHATEEAMVAQETPIAQQEVEAVPDQEDIDHA